MTVIAQTITPNDTNDVYLGCGGLTGKNAAGGFLILREWKGSRRVRVRGQAACQSDATSQVIGGDG